jgi:hypothetical protein
VSEQIPHIGSLCVHEQCVFLVMQGNERNAFCFTLGVDVDTCYLRIGANRQIGITFRGRLRILIMNGHANYDTENFTLKYTLDVDWRTPSWIVNCAKVAPNGPSKVEL